MKNILTLTLLLLCVLNTGVMAQNSTLNRNQNRHETSHETRPNLSRHQGTDQPGPGPSQGSGLLRGRTTREA